MACYVDGPILACSAWVAPGRPCVQGSRDLEPLGLLGSPVVSGLFSSSGSAAMASHAPVLTQLSKSKVLKASVSSEPCVP